MTTPKGAPTTGLPVDRLAQRADEGLGLRQEARTVVPLALGVAALFSAVALLGTILAGLALPLTLAATAAMLVATVGFIAIRLDGEERAAMLATAARAAAIGVAATATYDVTRTVLSRLDPSPYDPFELMPVFGRLLFGEGLARETAFVAGLGFHLLNGVSFAVAYAFLFRRFALKSPTWAIATGIGWGLFLETFQLTLYPGWLSIRFLAEFATISALSHVAYGVTLGYLGHRFLPRDETVEPDEAWEGERA